MEYNIKLTDEFLDELEEICDYISINLKACNSAIKLRVKVRDKIILLKKSPQRFAEIGKTDKLKREYRRMVIDNYIILYTVDENEKKVFISHIYYGKQDYFKY